MPIGNGLKKKDGFAWEENKRDDRIAKPMILLVQSQKQISPIQVFLRDLLDSSHSRSFNSFCTLQHSDSLHRLCMNILRIRCNYLNYQPVNFTMMAGRPRCVEYLSSCASRSSPRLRIEATFKNQYCIINYRAYIVLTSGWGGRERG